MRKIAVLFLAAGLALAGTEVSGRIKAFSSLFLSQNLKGPYFTHKSGDFFTKRIEVRLKVQGDISQNVSYGVRFDIFSSPDAIFSTPFPEAEPLGSPGAEEPFEGNLYEAYIKISDFLIPNLDFTIGKQRITWGSADKVNVVDNLNPIDFANFITFDPDYFAERRPQLSLNFEYYIGDNTKIQAVYLPQRQYSPLPYGFSRFLGIYSTSNAQVEIEHGRNDLAHTNFGLRFSTVVLNTDLGLTWYHGNFHLPVFTGVEYSQIEPLYQSEQVPYVIPEFSFSYPDLDVLGIDFSGEIFSVGFWGEVAYYMPEKILGYYTVGLMPLKPFQIMESGYFKYVFGFDYTIPVGNGVYVNAQFLHGMFDERDYTKEAEQVFGIRKGQFFGEIENYILARAEYKMAGDRVKVSLGGIVELGEKTSYAFMPSLEFRVKDALSIQAGVFSVSGDEETKFGAFKKDTMGYVSFKLDF